jgi:hypothetical protein
VDDDNVTLNEARQNALNALNDIACFGPPKYAMGAAIFLLTEPILAPEFESEVIVDEGDAPFIPCDCPVCEAASAEGAARSLCPFFGDDLPGDENLGLIFTYGVYTQ